MRYAIGVDIGGTKIEAALVNEKGKILSKYRLPTEAKKSAKTTANNIAHTISHVKTKPVKGIGISIAGVAKNGKMIFSPNIPKLLNFNLQSYLKKRLRS